ncbi:hypothetical protein Q3V30_22005 (plasmid) [Erwinia pyri]|uniref:Uncharacterized protein n=1 Tax=Erwinia pyri TaxID=3062598 RepID=A0AA50DQ79_9GAMM|nr:hypothetical protein [Erwinia sp. DE2]WLS81133.1 hypothetical protein Q3V30_22005 [Erwinia sp. DE2]
MRYNHARGPVSFDIKRKLVELIQTHKDADSLAEDIIELIAVGRSDPDGFRAVSTELDRMKSLDLKK